MTDSDPRPIALITGAAGNLGRSLGEALGNDYRIAAPIDEHQPIELRRAYPKPKAAAKGLIE